VHLLYSQDNEGGAGVETTRTDGPAGHQLLSAALNRSSVTNLRVGFSERGAQIRHGMSTPSDLISDCSIAGNK
jgi:hypothetical protein